MTTVSAEEAARHGSPLLRIEGVPEHQMQEIADALQALAGPGVTIAWGRSWRFVPGAVYVRALGDFMAAWFAFGVLESEIRRRVSQWHGRLTVAPSEPRGPNDFGTVPLNVRWDSVRATWDTWEPVPPDPAPAPEPEPTPFFTAANLNEWFGARSAGPADPPGRTQHHGSIAGHGQITQEQYLATDEVFRRQDQMDALRLALEAGGSLPRESVSEGRAAEITEELLAEGLSRPETRWHEFSIWNALPKWQAVLGLDPGGIAAGETQGQTLGAGEVHLSAGTPMFDSFGCGGQPVRPGRRARKGPKVRYRRVGEPGKRGHDWGSVTRHFVTDGENVAWLPEEPTGKTIALSGRPLIEVLADVKGPFSAGDFLQAQDDAAGGIAFRPIP